MGIKFTKMHGLGNDFIVVDCRTDDPGDWPALAKRLSHRRLGIGFDQAILLYDSDIADFRMDILNGDGSVVEMCGNGIRCLVSYIRERNLFTGEVIRVETLAGIQLCRFDGEMVVVDMGEPEFEGRKIPVDLDGTVREHPIPIEEGNAVVTCISMGNPHAVIFVDDVERYPVEEIGPQIENHPFFPNRINVEFVEVLDRNRVRMRVWERGAGVTMACGTGACASAVASFWTGRTERSVEVILDGGSLHITWEPKSEHVFMTGPSAHVFEGEFTI